MIASDTILITGADGYIGLRLASALLKSPGTRLHLWVRAASTEEFHHKLKDMQNALGIVAVHGERGSHYTRLSEQVICSRGDLTDEFPLAGVDPQTIGKIIHLAAITRFNVEAELADAVNVHGHRKVLQFARRCSSLTQYVLVSSVYACGLRPDTIHETLLDNAGGFSNHYERSKWQCEADLSATDFPWQIARVATVVADDTNGSVSQFNAVHNTLKLFYYGMLSLLPGKKDTTLYFVTCDFIVAALEALLNKAPGRVIYNLAYGTNESIELGQLIDTAYNSFLEQENFRRRRVLPPVYSDLESFMTLSESMISFGSGPLAQATSSIAPFARQLFLRRELRNDNMRSLLPDYSAPGAVQLIRNTCAYLAGQKWGRSHA